EMTQYFLFDTIIAAGSRPGVIGDAIACNPVGTRFHALETPLENRKRWIFGASKSAPPAPRWGWRRATPSRY
ncbi:hypothetical protein ACQPT6_17700, partial [Erwinia amylovora]